MLANTQVDIDCFPEERIVRLDAVRTRRQLPRDDVAVAQDTERLAVDRDEYFAIADVLL
jgi:hypothetical protein